MPSIKRSENKQKADIRLTNHLPKIDRENIISEIVEGLNSDLPSLPSKYFYDDYGSSLFEKITSQNEYYPTKTEKSIMKKALPRVMKSDSPIWKGIEARKLDIIELGSGDCSKISILLDSIEARLHEKVLYIPVDFSDAAIKKSSRILVRKYPAIEIHGQVADFLHHLGDIPEGDRRLLCFFGSTLGNLSRDAGKEFIINISQIMKKGDRFILGLDMVKDRAILEKAYNDDAGVTEKFNKNILNVINGMIDSDFQPAWFDHDALYNPEKMRIEMHLRANRYNIVRSPYFAENLSFHKGDSIQTENSHKFTKSHIEQFAEISDLHIENIFTDSAGWFNIVEFVR
ncbi:MAG: L-histidine N(alpha)-methyltransferase [Candidatus Zixiibacteriota bacterium]